MKPFSLFVFFLCGITARASYCDIVWMIDDSLSISRRNYNNAKTLIQKSLDAVRTGREGLFDTTYRNGIVEFAGKLQGELELTSEYERFIARLHKNSFDNSGSTVMTKAFRYLSEKVFKGEPRPSVHRVVFVITDGVIEDGKQYSRSDMVRRVSELFEEHGLHRLVYVMVSDSVGRIPPDPTQFVELDPRYNITRDLISVRTSSEPTQDIVDAVSAMVREVARPVTYDISLPPVTAKPTGQPTISPVASVAPTDAPTNDPEGNLTQSPTVDPTVTPTTSPTDVPEPTFSPTDEPTRSPSLPEPSNAPTIDDFYSESDFTTDAPTAPRGTSEPSPEDEGLGAGAIAGITIGTLAVAGGAGAYAYKKRNAAP